MRETLKQEIKDKLETANQTNPSSPIFSFFDRIWRPTAKIIKAKNRIDEKISGISWSTNQGRFVKIAVSISAL